MNAAGLAGLLSEPERLRAVAALALGAATVAEVMERGGLDHRTATTALGRLEAGGLVSTVDGVLVLQVGAFKDAARAAARQRASDEPSTGDATTDAVLRAFSEGGRLIRLPAARGKRRRLLEHIVTAFEPGVRYPEPEVDTMLRAWYPDYASLRRYLVDEHLLAREAGVYWRVGGPVDIAPQALPAKSTPA